MALVKQNSEPPAGSRELYRDAYVLLLFDERLALVRSVRSALPFPDMATVEKTFGAIIALLDRHGRQGLSLLSDVRAAPGRNDPEFETLMLRLRRRMNTGFARLGVLVATAVGAMQVRRIAREEGIERMISTDEAELLRYLTAAADSPK